MVIGESGCGKSVLLKLMMALLSPSSGDVSWMGRPLAERSSRELSRERLRFGYLFQGAALFDSLLANLVGNGAGARQLAAAGPVRSRSQR